MTKLTIVAILNEVDFCAYSVEVDLPFTPFPGMALAWNPTLMLVIPLPYFDLVDREWEGEVDCVDVAPSILPRLIAAGFTDCTQACLASGTPRPRPLLS